MSSFESQKSAVASVRKDPNFMLIALGAATWFFGFYIIIFRPILVTAGFLLTCYATAVSALNRPVEPAWPGIVLGALLFMVGDFVGTSVPAIGALISPVFLVTGGVLILFFAIPLAIQRGNAPLAEALQRVAKGPQKKKEKEEKSDDDAD